MPRSPSRDVVDRFTGNRGYFHRADPLRRWKNLAALGAVGLFLGWLAVELAMPGKAANAHTHGELANPHAAFDSNCQACHNEHSASDFLSNPLSAFKAQSRWHDLTCTKCHAGPAHHDSVKDKAFHEQCSNCHHDHNGRGFSLVKLDDSHCVKCHETLPSGHTAKSITNFGKDHPEFQSLQVERGLKFSHGLHMTPGLVYAANDQHKWTPESLGKAFPDSRDRYSSESGNPSDPVQLNCVSCHQLDAGQAAFNDPLDGKSFEANLNALPGASKRSLLPARAQGAAYLPVNFDLHCKTCHPLRTTGAKSGTTTLEGFFVPHRRQPDLLKPYFRGAFALQLTADKASPILKLPLGPGGRLDPKDAPEAAAFGTELDRLTNDTARAVGATCAKCHYPEAIGKTNVLALPDKSIWFEHAKFNHSLHRGLTCASCHPGTGASFTLNEKEPPLILGVKSCQACHAKTGQAVELPTGQTVSAAGIRHSCTDCHRYHNGDRPRQGLGSRHRDPDKPLNLEQFLNGGKGQP